MVLVQPAMFDRGFYRPNAKGVSESFSLFALLELWVSDDRENAGELLELGQSVELYDVVPLRRPDIYCLHLPDLQVDGSERQ